MLHDEKYYLDPMSYKPERFIKDGKIDPDVFDPSQVAFGFGRRYARSLLNCRSDIDMVRPPPGSVLGCTLRKRLL